MKRLEELGGHGSMQSKDWQYLVEFRLFLPQASANMLLDCLFQVCNGRVCTSPKTYSEIHGLHPKAHPWPKIFLLFETYCAELLSEEHGGHKAVSHNGPSAKTVKTLDTKAIKQLAEQNELLVQVKSFFTKVVRHYFVDVEHEGASDEKKMLANATLMKALGRTLWKVAEQLLTHKKASSALGSTGPVVGHDQGKVDLVEKIMKGRLEVIEERYANHLENAGVFAGACKRPAPLHKRLKSKVVPPNAAGTTKRKHHDPIEAAHAPVVTIMSDGTIDTQMSIADVCRTLGLTGDGIGQSVAVRSHEVLAGTGIAHTADTVKIAALNPPEADIIVEGTTYVDGNVAQVTKQLTVAVDQLAPLNTTTAAPKLGPLELGCEPQMPRFPPFTVDHHTRALMTQALEKSISSLACASANNVDEQVDVVYIPPAGQENGQGVIQARAKIQIPCGTLRLHPYGGTLLQSGDKTGRSVLEKKFDVKSCYLRGVLVSAKVSRNGRQHANDFIVYSAMSHKPSSVTDEKLELQHVSPFWAVMLAGRDQSHMVNMIPYMEEYRVVHPTPKHHGEVKPGWTMSVKLPFLTNSKELAEGDLLVVPFDGGMGELCCEAFPPISI